jgi:hypothetical protein
MRMKSVKWFGSVVLLSCLLAFCAPPPELPKPEKIIENMTIKGDFSEADVRYFLDYRKQIEGAMKAMDVERSFAYYSPDFMNDARLKLEDLKKNTRIMFKAYRDIRYVISEFKVQVNRDTALSEDRFVFTAVPKDPSYKPLAYKGKERIYWQKQDNVWKIVNWVYE